MNIDAREEEKTVIEKKREYEIKIRELVTEFADAMQKEGACLLTVRVDICVTNTIGHDQKYASVGCVESTLQ